MPGLQKINQSKGVTPFPRRRQGGFSTAKLFKTCGLMVICFLLLVIAVQFIQQHQLKIRLAEYEARIEELTARNAAVAEEIRRLQDESYIEMLARKRLGLVKPGEMVFWLED